MAIDAGESLSRNEVDVSTEHADDAAPDWDELAFGDLPLRPVSCRQSVQRIRCMDDPEILQRVLQGLVNLI